MKHRLERLVLGWVMAVAAYLLDRRLRRVRHDEPEALPAAEWVDLPDCGHLPQHDDPELVARTILELTNRAPVTKVR